MEYFKRDVDTALKGWVECEYRDVLLLRGARQVGKSRSARQLGGQFDHFVEVNFEETPELVNVFEGSRDPGRICERLSAYFGEKIEPGKSLLFIDEIQECENALHALRFFKEKMPGLHVIAAGSLLEFILADIASYGVGRIQSLYLHPMNFGEFIQAAHSKELRELLCKIGPEDQLDDATRKLAFDAYRVYTAIGGLPEVVSLYVRERDLSRCQTKLSSLVSAYQTDFAKYRAKVPVERLRDAFSSVAKQAGKKFVYTHISESGGAKEYKEAVSALVMAGLCHQVFHTTSAGIPLGAERNPKRFKLIPFDLGIYQSLSHLNLSRHILATETELINKGVTAEISVGLELCGYASAERAQELYYWHREARSSNAEVDYVVELEGQIVPIEVKSNGSGAMKSMHLFLESKDSPFGLRVSHEDFGQYGDIRTFPIVALEQLRSRLR